MTREIQLQRALVDIHTANTLLNTLRHASSAQVRARQFSRAVWLCHSASNGQDELRGRRLTRVGRMLRDELEVSITDTWLAVTATCYGPPMAA
jgi:hypothetical protein